MAFGIYVEFNPSVSIPRGLNNCEGVDLMNALDYLDELASADEGVRPLSSFARQVDVPEDFEGDPEEALELFGVGPEWFDVQDGLKTCVFLLDRMPMKAKKLSAAREELEALKESLIHAASKGVALFRLEGG